MAVARACQFAFKSENRPWHHVASRKFRILDFRCLSWLLISSFLRQALT